MKHTLIKWSCAIATSLLLPAAALAAPDKPTGVLDMRLEGYASGVTIETASPAVTWILLVALGAVCIGVLFKDAHRTHLD
jgi:hypothetical protein